MRPAASAVLVAAGAGTRLGHEMPKALVPLAGRPLVAWCGSALRGVAHLDAVVVVVPDTPDDAAGEALVRALRGVGIEALRTHGGARRRDSVAAGLACVTTELVAIHDAARPLASADLWNRALDAAARCGAAVPGVPVPDTLVRADAERIGAPLSREGVFAVQTPQAFRTEVLRRAHALAAADWDASDDGSMVLQAGGEVALVPGERRNLKVTWPEDLQLALAWVSADGSGGAS